MASERQTDKLTEALAQFEKRLEIPIVPGEMPAWCEDAKAASDTLQTELQDVIQQAHPKSFQQIHDEDVSLEPRIEAMRATDTELLAAMEKVHHQLTQLTDAGEAVEPEEEKVDEHLRSIIDDGLALVIAVRKQQAAIDTWYIEALERDRGVAD